MYKQHLYVFGSQEYQLTGGLDCMEWNSTGKLLPGFGLQLNGDVYICTDKYLYGYFLQSTHKTPRFVYNVNVGDQISLLNNKWLHLISLTSYPLSQSRVKN